VIRQLIPDLCSIIAKGFQAIPDSSDSKIRRLKTIAVETFKIIHKNSPSYLHDLINIKLQNYNFRSQETAVLPRVRTIRYGLKSFRYNAAQIWNELPNHCRRERSLGQFKNLIQMFNID
jgi:hypothetical protein